MTRKDVRGLKAYHRENFRIVSFKEWSTSREAQKAISIAHEWHKNHPWCGIDKLVYAALTSKMAYKLK